MFPVASSKSTDAAKAESPTGFCATTSVIGRSTAKRRRSPLTEYCGAGNVTFSPRRRAAPDDETGEAHKQAVLEGKPAFRAVGSLARAGRYFAAAFFLAAQ